MVFYVVLAFYSDIHKISSQFMKINIEYLILVLLLETLAFSVRGYRQQKLLQIIGIKMSFFSSLKLFLAGYSMVVTPGGSGEVIKSQFLKNSHETSISKTSPIVIMERFHDLTAAVTIIIIMLFLSGNHLLTSLTMIVLSSIILGAIYILMRDIRFLTKLRNKILTIKFLNRFVPSNEFHETFVQLSGPRIMIIMWIISTISWSIDALSAYSAFLAMGINLGFVNTTQMVFVSTVFGALSFLPGGVGITEGSLIRFLVQSGLKVYTASSLVLFVRLTSIWYATALGFIATHFILRESTTKNNSTDKKTKSD